MPWKVFKQDSKFVVRKLDAEGEPTGDPLGSHSTEAEATAQQRALYAAENSKAAVKFADVAETEIEGLGMPWGGPFRGQDISGEHFSAKTDFAFDWFPEDARPLLYHHGLDKDAGASVVGRVKGYEVKADLGVWTKAQLDASSEYFDAIKDLVKAGKLFFSSGSMRHLVDVAKSGEINRWPWVELSLTPTPCNLYAELDFASAEKHYEAAGIKADLSALKLASSDLPDVAADKKQKPDQMRQMIGDMAQKMEIDMSDSEMERLLGSMEGMEEAEAREHAKKKMDKMAKKSVSIKAMSGSYEHLMECLNGLINPYNPFGMSDRWAYVEATFPDYFIAKQYADGECCYWRVEYAMDEDGCPKLGKMEQVEETYIPKTEMAGMDMPVSDHAEMTKAFAAGLVERTKDLRERRIKEGRIISTSNRRKLGDCLTGMRAACDEMQALLDSTEPQTAKAASVRQRLALLSLYNATLSN